jgi:hypothetical protein
MAWLSRIASLLALAVILVGPQAMALSRCTEQEPPAHHHSRQHQAPQAPMQCCVLCVVVCSGGALAADPVSRVITSSAASARFSGMPAQPLPAPTRLHLRPPPIGPPALLA